jgi:HSP20 family molecular chaperone IbpA
MRRNLRSWRWRRGARRHDARRQRPAQAVGRPREEVGPDRVWWIESRLGQLVVCLDVPGAVPATVSVSVDEGWITVTGRQIDALRPRGVRFARRIAVPEGVSTALAWMTLENGVLTIGIPIDVAPAGVSLPRQCPARGDVGWTGRVDPPVPVPRPRDAPPWEW